MVHIRPCAEAHLQHHSTGKTIHYKAIAQTARKRKETAVNIYTKSNNFCPNIYRNSSTFVA